jgi:protein-disulfide isomerase
MKNLVLVLALSLGSLSAFAQDKEEAQTVATEVVVAQDEFSEIAASELPEAVTAAVAKNYPTAKIDKAYANEAKQYKLEVSLEDGTSGTLYADENGNWIEM